MPPLGISGLVIFRSVLFTFIRISSDVVLLVCVCDISGAVYDLTGSLVLLCVFSYVVGCRCRCVCVYAGLWFLPSMRLCSLTVPARCVCIGASIVLLSPLVLPFQSSIFCRIAIRIFFTHVARLLSESVYHPPQRSPRKCVVGLFCCVKCLCQMSGFCAGRPCVGQ